MRIEKISENQIRCTLSREDLVDRELRISELAYGTEKAKALFRDMMQQAHFQFGFDAEDIPLMIEAIPVSPESLVLVITKVEDPDELDTRFSKFSPDDTETYDDEKYDDDDDDYMDNIFHAFAQSVESSEDFLDDEDEFEDANSFFSPQKQTPEKNREKEKHDKASKLIVNIAKVYSFQSLDIVTQMSNVVAGFYEGKNSLYKNPVNSIYYLLITKSDYTPDEFNKIGHVVSEYGILERSTYASPYYYDEHYELIIKDNAIQVLNIL